MHIEVVLYAVFTLVLILVGLKYLNREPRNFLYRPIVMFLFVMAFVHAVMPVVEIVSGTYSLQAEYSLENHIVGLGVTLLGIVGVLVGASVGRGRGRQGQSPRRYHVPRHQIVTFTIGVAIPALLASYQLYSMVGQIGYEEFLRDRIGNRAGVQHWVILSNLIVVVPAFFLAVYLAGRRHWLPLVCAIAALLLTAVFVLATGSRHSVFLGLVCCALAFLFFSPSLVNRRTIQLSMLLVAGAFLLTTYGQYRKAAVSGAAEMNLTAVSLVDAASGAFGNHELVLWLADNGSVRHYGETYLAGFTVFIPRQLWLGKPLGAGPRIKNEVQPGSYEVGRRGSSSFTTGFIVESWMNFGPLGVFPVGIVLGVALAGIGRIARRVTTPYSITLVSFLVLNASVLIVYGEFLGWMARTVPVTIGMFTAWCVGLIVVRAVRKPRPRHSYAPLRNRY